MATQGGRFFSLEIRDRFQNGEISERQKRKLSKTQVIPGVTIGDVNKHRGLKATANHFNKNSVEEVNKDIDDIAIAQMILHNRKVKEAQERTDAILEEGEAEIDQRVVQARVEEKLEKYLGSFSAETPNDLFKLSQLCLSEVQIELIDEALTPLTSKGAGRREVDDLFSRRDDLQKRYLDLEKSLQLDPKGRVEAQGSRKASDIIRDTLLQFREFLKENILQVFHCNILVAWIWHGFPTHPWKVLIMQCPKCGKEFPVPYPDKWRKNAISQEDFMKDLDFDEIDLMAKRGLFSNDGDEEAGPDMVGVF